MSVEITNPFPSGIAKFDPIIREDYSVNVIVVGCGGTGGRLIPVLAQHIANHNRAFLNGDSTLPVQGTMCLYIVDFDVVEPKNLKRQNFFAFDVGRGKAEVLAERMSALYGLDVISFKGTYKEFSDNTKMRATYNNIIFDCTDNIEARRSIESHANSYSAPIIISCGNEDTYGQVMISVGSIGEAERYQQTIRNFQAVSDQIAIGNGSLVKYYTFLPTLLDLNPLLQDKVKESCADMRLVNDQSMPINMLVANIAYNAFYNIISRKKLDYHSVSCSINNVYTTKFITDPFYLRKVYAKALYCSDSDETIELALESNRRVRPHIFKEDTLQPLLSKYKNAYLPHLKMALLLNYSLSPSAQIAIKKIINEITAGTYNFDSPVSFS